MVKKIPEPKWLIVHERKRMQLTTEMVRRFVDGELRIQEVRNNIFCYVFSGKIAAILVENSTNTLIVVFQWAARNVASGSDVNWVKDDQIMSLASLGAYEVTTTSPNTEGVTSVCLYSPVIGELAVLSPPHKSNLDRSEVEGLEQIHM